MQYNNIKDVAFYSREHFSDERGVFCNLVTADESSYSFTKAKHTLRGLHGDPDMAKYVSVLHGKVWDVVADVRQDSPTFGKWDAFILDAASPSLLYVPPGCAHGFLTLTDDVVFYYAKTAHYSQEREFGVYYGDPLLGIMWPYIVRCISAKDAGLPLLTRK